MKLAAALVAMAASVPIMLAQTAATPLTFAFEEIGSRAGLNVPTIYGGKQTNRYLLETTGCGVAAFDYDSDGWLDVFIVNGTTLD